MYLIICMCMCVNNVIIYSTFIFACIERQQLVADIERLTSDKANLFSRLRHCEEDLKTANECENCFNIIILIL